MTGKDRVSGERPRGRGYYRRQRAKEEEEEVEEESDVAGGLSSISLVLTDI